MTIYVDKIQRHGSGPWCHMITDKDLEELHQMAEKIGLKRGWFQPHPRHPHYDLRPSKRTLALLAGAQVCQTVEIPKLTIKLQEGET